MTRSSIRRSVLAVSFAGAAALVASGCGQESPEVPAVLRQAAPMAPKPAALNAEDVCTYGTPCAPTGAHGKLAPGYTVTGGHSGFDCNECHYVGGRLAFKPNGKAAIPGGPGPAFDPVAKTCSNIACHTVPAGLPFSYYFPGGDGEPVLNTVFTIGNPSGVTPSWYATGSLACAACHPNPPANGSTGSNVWHSGLHANQGPTGPANQCQFCHPDATGTGGVGTAITNASLHANGAINVQARFTSSCFGCH